MLVIDGTSTLLEFSGLEPAGLFGSWVFLQQEMPRRDSLATGGSVLLAALVDKGIATITERV